MTNSSYFTRVAAVTGSNRGLGFEFVKQLSSDDSTLVIAFVRSQTESLEKLGRENIKIVKMDAANPESIAVSRPCAFSSSSSSFLFFFFRSPFRTSSNACWILSLLRALVDGRQGSRKGVRWQDRLAHQQCCAGSWSFQVDRGVSKRRHLFGTPPIQSS